MSQRYLPTEFPSPCFVVQIQELLFSQIIYRTIHFGLIQTQNINNSRNELCIAKQTSIGHYAFRSNDISLKKRGTQIWENYTLVLQNKAFEGKHTFMTYLIIHKLSLKLSLLTLTQHTAPFF